MMAMERTKISLEQIELWNSPNIALQLPVNFSTGFTFSSMSGRCLECNKELSDGDVHGKVLRPTPNVAEIFAIGYCCGCKLLTPYRFRVYDDKRFIILQKEGWLEGQLKASRTTRFFSKIKRAVRWLFTF